MMMSRATIRRCRAAERRSIRPGSWAIRRPSRASCSTGNTHQPGTRPRCGIPRYRMVAASTAVAIGQRGSATGPAGPGSPVSLTPLPAVGSGSAEGVACRMQTVEVAVGADLAGEPEAIELAADVVARLGDGEEDPDGEPVDDQAGLGDRAGGGLGQHELPLLVPRYNRVVGGEVAFDVHDQRQDDGQDDALFDADGDDHGRRQERDPELVPPQAVDAPHALDGDQL